MIRPRLAQATPSISVDLNSPAWAALTASKRVYNRLDWWELNDWHQSDALIALPAKHRDAIGAALLVVPIAFTHIQQLASACAPAAWVRWCAVADRQSPSAMLRGLLHEAEQRLQGTPVRELWCVCEPHEWLATNLRDLGFKPCDELITMSRLSSQAAPQVQTSAVAPGITLRSLNPLLMSEREMTHVQTLDEAAFEPHWRYSPYMLRQAFKQSCYVTIAEREECIVGYQCAMRDAHDAEAIATSTGWWCIHRHNSRA